MRVVIAGAGEVGLHLSKMFTSDNNEVILIDNREERLKQIKATIDIKTFQGSAASLDILKMAKVSESDLFISVTNSEHTNIISSIIAKRFGVKKCLARIDNLEYLDDEKSEYFKQLGVDFMFYPELIVAQEITNLIQQSASSDSMSYSGGKLCLQLFRANEYDNISGQTVADLVNISRNLEFKVVGIVRGDTTFIPENDEIFQEDDLIYVIATQKGLQMLYKNSGKKQENINSVMILGGSRVGINTARQLAHKQSVKLIEINRTKAYEISNSLSGVLVINGDGRDIDLLKREGIEHTDAFISVTGDSEINMISCMIAKRLGVKKTIADIENSEYIRLAENMDIDTIINKKIHTASKIFSFTRTDEVSSVSCLTCSNAEVLEYVAKPESPIVQKPLKDIKIPQGIVIGGVIRGDDSFIPDDDFVIRPFDKVLVFALSNFGNNVNKLFKPSERFF